MKGNNMISKIEAKRNGLKTYNDCSPCYKNHPPCRYTKTGKCVHCHREKASINRQTPPSIRGQVHGLVYIRQRIHKDDVETVKAFCAALRFDRGIPSDLT